MCANRSENNHTEETVTALGSRHRELEWLPAGAELGAGGAGSHLENFGFVRRGGAGKENLWPRVTS